MEVKVVAGSSMAIGNFPGTPYIWQDMGQRPTEAGLVDRPQGLLSVTHFQTLPSKVPCLAPNSTTSWQPSLQT